MSPDGECIGQRNGIGPAKAFGCGLLLVVPRSVFSECLAQAWAPDAEAIRGAVESGVLVVRDDAQWPVGTDVPRLDSGELAALSLARDLGAPVLMDERRGRRACCGGG